MDDLLDEVIETIIDEIESATLKHGNFNSPHEAYSVILEEMDELWTEIKSNKGRNEEAMNEAKQIAAMAIRYILDLKYD